MSQVKHTEEIGSRNNSADWNLLFELLLVTNETQTLQENKQAKVYEPEA